MNVISFPLPQKDTWFLVRNIAARTAEISIYDEIGLSGITADVFISELKSLGDRRINLRIHSPGGSVFDGNAIFNALRRHPGGVDVSIDGLAASMASVIAMVGDRRRMAANAMLMIHNPAVGIFGESKDMRREADLLEEVKENIISTYAGATGLPREELSRMMDEETWLTAEEAKDLGFVTDISEPFKAAAKFERFDIGQFGKTPPAATLLTKEAEIQAYANRLLEITNELHEAKQKIADLTNDVAAAVAQRDNFKTLMNGLKRVHGIAPASVVPSINPPSEGPAEILAKFNRITDPVARARFYEENKEALAVATQA